MKYILLSLALTASAAANSKNIISDETGSSEISMNSLAPATISLAAPRRYGDGGTSVNFMYDLFGSDFISKFSAPGFKGAGALNWGAEFGMMIKLHSRNDNTTNVINVGVYGMQLTIRQKTTNLVTGDKKDDKQNISSFGVPISFEKIGGGDGAGFYYEIGASFSHVFSATLNGQDISKNFNSVYVEPFLGFGISTPFSIINRRTRDEQGHGKALLGPFFSYVVTNMSSVSGVKVGGHSFGLMWRYRFE